ncbi:MAG: FAD-binding oxidoreductase [Chloroflexota bacterium]
MVLMPSTRAKSANVSLEKLQSRLQGSVFVPGDLGYDDSRKAWNVNVDHRPAVIVIARSTNDVVEAIRFANEKDLGVAVQSTGHGVSRPADNDSLLIIMAHMRNVVVDAKGQTAWVEGGAKWAVVLEKAQAVGLAPLLGSSPDVGAVGYTLGGGMGWLARKHGLSADSVNFFEVVNASGETLHVSAEENSDLFWGLRGGGGSFGVITGMEMRLYPVTTVFGGNLMYPVAVAKEVFTRYREWIKNAPDELTASIGIMNFPPIPQVPEFLRGQSAVFVRGCFAGPVEEGKALIQPWLDWMEPMVNQWRLMPFSQVGMISNEPEDPSPGLSTGLWLRELTNEAIDTILKHAISVNGSSAIVVTEIRYAGGAIGKVKADVNAYGNRDANLLLQMIGMAPTPEIEQVLKGQLSQVKEALGSHLTGSVYINFMEGEEKWARTKDAFLPETYQKLMALKALHDPQNRFRYSFNIPPKKA